MRNSICLRNLCGVVFFLTLSGGCEIAQQSDGLMSPEDLADKVTEIWSAHDTDIVDDAFADEGIYEDVAMQAAMRGKAEIKKFMEETLAGFPDFDVKQVRFLSTENMIASEWIMSGTHTGDFPGFKATGKPFSVRGASVGVVRDGKIVRWTDYYDRYDLMSQLGAYGDSNPGQGSGED